MDRVTDLTQIVQREVADYNNVIAWKSQSFYLEDMEHQIYMVVDVPNADHPLVKNPGIIVMARVLNDKVVIDEDKTDKPLYEELVNAGIPRSQIILAYAGESLPSESETS
jgi:hypothetical protein